MYRYCKIVLDKITVYPYYLTIKQAEPGGTGQKGKRKMYHFTNLGLSSSRYADLRGFIPECGDKPEQFVFDTLKQDDFENNSDLWENFIREAQESLLP